MPLDFRRTLLALSACLIVGACGERFADINRDLDRRAMTLQVGREYASLVQARPPSLPFEIPAEPPFGDRIGSSELPNGYRLHRHLTRSIGERSTVDLFGLVSTERERAAYRLIYFKVDPNGVITETANGYIRGEVTECVGYLGGIFRNCEDPARLAADLTFLDAQVRTSDGRPVSAWFNE